MASSTSCCGVKKQKLGNGTLPQSLSCVSSNGAVAPAPGKSPRACSSADYHCDDADVDASSTLNALAQHRTKVVNHDMVVYCFDVLQAFLRGLEAPKAPKSFPSEQFPLFVTWKLGRDKKLRGCIGTFNSTGLHHGLREYAITRAANRDVADLGPLGASTSVILEWCHRSSCALPHRP
uniref:AMMECR1 domain-containing protein n=1 Tax=Plectus sambesii TaxID=2011161 RepID=A0A914UM69_9BILA